MRTVPLVALLLASASATADGQATWRLERAGSTAGDDRMGGLSGIVAGRDGSIYAIDWKATNIAVYDSAGRRASSIGRKGAGPGEFRSINGMAWIADTLVVYDMQLGRLSYFSNGAYLRTTQWSFPEKPSRFLGAGGSSLVVVAYGRGTPVPIPGLEHSVMNRRPSKTFIRHGPNGSLERITGTSSPADPIPHTCWGDSKGMIYELDDHLAGNGPFDAVTTAGARISLPPDRSSVFWSDASGRRAIGTYRPVPVTDAVWRREAREVRDIEQKEGKVTCHPEWVRPRQLPAVRSIAADDRGGLWVEVTTDTGTRFDVYDAKGSLIARTAGPGARWQSIPFVVRGDAMYLVERDADDVLSVTIYRIRR